MTLPATDEVGAAVVTTPPVQAARPLGFLGAVPSISANGDQDGIVWVISSENFGRLQAYDAARLTQLYDSQAQAAERCCGEDHSPDPAIIFDGDDCSVVASQSGFALYAWAHGSLLRH